LPCSTTKPAGEVKPDGAYPEGTVNFLIHKRLKELAEQAKTFRGNGEPLALANLDPEVTSSLRRSKKEAGQNIKL